MEDNQPNYDPLEPIGAMLEFSSEWNQIRMMAVVCNQMFDSFIHSGFTEEQALRLTAFMVRED